MLIQVPNKPKTENRKPKTPLAARLLEIALGGVFLYAGALKHLHPQEFAEAILAYQLLPQSLVGTAAAVIPWTELAAGLFLIFGLKRRSCLLILALLTGSFMVVLLITMARGLKIDCGCGLFSSRQVGWGAVLIDAAFLVWAAVLYWWELPARGES
ncbi:MAG: DoxX family membrane protein [Deltaproteobacteria bacterium]|nr:DoxX family membrane protein [Deltaproteobacteria bacterium]